VKNKLVFDDITVAVFEAIEANGGEVYIVGGTVRDLYINQRIEDFHDIDVEVYHISLTKLQTVLATFGMVNEVGKSFGILKVSSLPKIDFALPRQEKTIGEKHTDFSVIVNPDMDKKIASSRRDITMNAMLYEYHSGRILDFYEGQKDIDLRQIRMVNKETFKEDPLRVLRVARFAAKYQFVVEEETKQWCQQMVQEGLLNTLSKERVYEEYCQILMCGQPSIGFTFLRSIGALPKYLEDLQTTMQRLDYHPEGSVWNHTMLVIDIAALCRQQSSYPLAFMWSCLLHDIGKPKKTTPEGSSPKHHLAGVDVFDQECRSLIPSKKMKSYIKTMILYHMEIMNMARNSARDKIYYRLLHDIDGILPLNDLWLLTKCDKLGRLRDGSEGINEAENYLQDKIERLGKDALVPCIDGEVLLSLGYLPGKQFSEMLKEAYVMQMQGNSKEAIIKEMKRKY
jgi:tRNA nucleotidyltransferase (CCA-adding enzyme)